MDAFTIPGGERVVVMAHYGTLSGGFITEGRFGTCETCDDYRAA